MKKDNRENGPKELELNGTNGKRWKDACIIIIINYYCIANNLSTFLTWSILPRADASLPECHPFAVINYKVKN